MIEKRIPAYCREANSDINLAWKTKLSSGSNSPSTLYFYCFKDDVKEKIVLRVIDRTVWFSMLRSTLLSLSIALRLQFDGDSLSFLIGLITRTQHIK